MELQTFNSRVSFFPLVAFFTFKICCCSSFNKQQNRASFLAKFRHLELGKKILNFFPWSLLIKKLLRSSKKFSSSL